MNNLETMKQRFVSALDKSDTPKEFILNIFEEVYQQGYEDGRSVMEQIKAEIQDEIETAEMFEDKGLWYKHSKKAYKNVLNIISRHIKEYKP